MKLLIICAMQEELDAVNQILELPLHTRQAIAYPNYNHYQNQHHLIISALSGIGKVNAAITTQHLIDKFTPDGIINVGVAGSLVSELEFGDIIIARDLVQHDVDVRAFGLPLGQIPRVDTWSFNCDANLRQLVATDLSLARNQVVHGRIVSGDQFIDNGTRAQEIRQQFAAVACDMEGAAIAQVCYLNRIAFVVVRALSDMAGQAGAGARTYNELKHMAACNAAQVIQHFIGKI